MSSTEHIKIFTDTVVKQTILQGKEDERKNPGTFSMGELAFTRDTARVFVGTHSEEEDTDDYGFEEGGLIVGNKYHGDFDFSENTENKKYVSDYYGNNLYTGDFLFDTSDNSLVIVEKDKDIRVPSYTFNTSTVTSTEKSLLAVVKNTLKNEVSINVDGLNDFINDKVSTGVTDLIVTNTCSIPKNITLTGATNDDTHNVTFDFSKTKADSSYVLTISVDEQGNKTFLPLSTSDFLGDKLVYLKEDPQNPGIVVRNITDGAATTGITYSIGLNSTDIINKVIEIVEKQMNAAQTTSSNIRSGLVYLSSLKVLPFTNNIIDKSISEIELSEEDGMSIPYTAQSVILQITTKPDSVTRIRHLKSNGVLLLELPENSSSQITTVEVPLIENDDMNDKKFTIHSTSNPTVKLLGYRI